MKKLALILLLGLATVSCSQEEEGEDCFCRKTYYETVYDFVLRNGVLVYEGVRNELSSEIVPCQIEQVTEGYEIKCNNY